MSKTSLLSLAITLLVGGQLANAENARAVVQAGEGEDIDFSVIGGEEELPTHVERTKNLNAFDFVRRHRYLMFIGRDSQNELYLMWGPLGIYDITSPVVTSMSPGWRRHDGMDATSFVTAAKAAAKR